MKNNQINIYHLNIYHLFNSFLMSTLYLKKTNDVVHILGLSETRLDNRIEDKDISIRGYTLFRRDKNLDKHTGLVAYIHNSIANSVKRRRDLEYQHIESLWLEIKQDKSTPLLICFIYRNPSSNSEWQDQFQIMMDKIPDKKYELLMLGDFNIDLHKPQQSWNTLTSLLGLKQLITDYTRVTHTSKTIIDHIYTNNIHKVKNINVISSSISDHFLIQCTYHKRLLKRPPKEHSYIKHRCYKKIDEKHCLAHTLLDHYLLIMCIVVPNPT